MFSQLGAGGWGGYHHPSLSQVEAREDEILAWDRKCDLRDKSSNWSLFVAVALVVACFVMALSFGTAKWLWFATFTSVLVTTLVHVLWKPPAVPRPEPIDLIRFTPQENLYMMGVQPRARYETLCQCPSCGTMAVHGFLSCSADGDWFLYEPPDWAAVIRRCDVCFREWAQW